jgi:hypothetical protein
MKLIALLAFAFAFNATAAEVKSAKLDSSKKNILVDVVYGGGCKKHVFKLEVGACLESYPVQCTAALKHSTIGGPDLCEALISETVVINLKKAGLDDSYYAGGKLTITGDRGFTGEPSQATIRLPKN